MFNVADVKRPLVSAAKNCEAGNRVVMDPNPSGVTKKNWAQHIHTSYAKCSQEYSGQNFGGISTLPGLKNP